MRYFIIIGRLNRGMPWQQCVRPSIFNISVDVYAMAEQVSSDYVSVSCCEWIDTTLRIPRALRQLFAKIEHSEAAMATTGCMWHSY